MIRGSLITLKRKCGKPTCSCVDGEPHTTPALYYSVKGKTRMLTLRNSDVFVIRQAFNNYKAVAAELEKKAISGISGCHRRTSICPVALQNIKQLRKNTVLHKKYKHHHQCACISCLTCYGSS